MEGCGVWDLLGIRFLALAFGIVRWLVGLEEIAGDGWRLGGVVCGKGEVFRDGGGVEGGIRLSK